jgi:VanZ family protein
MAAIAYLSHQTEPLGRTASNGEAGMAHLTLYAVLGLLLLWALAGGASTGRELWVLPFFAFGLAVLFGLIDELHQATVRGRTASEADLAIDALGAALGVILGALLAGFLRLIRRNP